MHRLDQLEITDADLAGLITRPKSDGVESLMIPLHAPEGGPARAWLCGRCRRPTRTRRGLVSHLFLRHGIKRQLPLFA